MKILLTGGTGFIGKELCNRLLQQGHKLTVLSRKPDQVSTLCGASVKAIKHLDDIDTQTHFDAIINLAGAGIVDARWSSKRKQILLDSRIKTTAQLISYIATAPIKPKILVSGSAIGYYGNQGDTELDENASARDDFAHRLCAKWESTAKQAQDHGVRVCLLRTGLVIGNDGGFLSRMLPPFKLGLGGRLGNGKQWMSWIHRNDIISIIELLLNTTTLAGAFNATAPNPVTNMNFSRCLAKVLKRPALLPVPELILKLLLGEMSELLLGGQRVLPIRVQQENFKFEFSTLEAALQDVV